MTRTEFRFVKRAVNMAAQKLEGAPPSVIESYMWDEIQKALAYAKDEDAGELGNEVGQVEPGKLPQPPTILNQSKGPIQWQEGGGLASMPDADPQTIPKTQLVPVDRPSFLILPGQEGFASQQAGKPTVGTPERLRVWREPKKRIRQGAYAERWQLAISELVGIVNAHMPPVILVTPTGAQAKLSIERTNTKSDVMSGNVKVEYGIPGQTGSSKSQKNSRGEIMDAMRIDRVVTSTFNIKDETVNWEQRVADVITMAEDVFKPRPSEIANNTPAKLGAIDTLFSGGNPLTGLRTAGGYGTAGDDPSSEAGGSLVIDPTKEVQKRRGGGGPVVPSL